VPITIVSQAVEDSSKLVMAALALHLRQEALLRTAPTVHGRLHGGSRVSPPAQVRAQATLVRLVSIAEAFVATQLASRLEGELPGPRKRLVESIFVNAEDRALATWPNLKEHYQNWIGIKFSDSSPLWLQLDAFINGRNAIMHGLGELTRRQARKNLPQLETNLRSVGLIVHGGRITIPTNALQTASRVCRDFIHWLDTELQGRP
jgi:hypothetical protein